MVIDAGLDRADVADRLTASYCVLAPRKLAAQVEHPRG